MSEEETKPDDSSETKTTEVKTEAPKDTVSVSKKKLATTVLVVLAGLLLVGGGFWLTTQDADEDTETETTQDAEDATLKAAVTLIDGSAQYSEDGEAWRELTDDMTLEQGTHVRTEADSRVILTLDDGSVVRLNNDSTIVLTSLAADDVSVGNEFGEVYTRVVASDRTFTVTVNDDAYEALGTAYATTNTAKVKGVQVYQSNVSLKEKELRIKEGKQYYTKHSDKDLAEKLTVISLAKLKKDDFAKWNLAHDKKLSEFKNKLGYLAGIEKVAEKEKENEEEKEDEPSSDGIALSGSSTSGGVYLSWTVSGVSGMDGFKAVYSKDSATPTYGKHSAQYVDGGSTRETKVGVTDGKTYYFRVCAYKNGSCTNYSNAVQVKAPYKAEEEVIAGTVSLSVHSSGVKVTWSITGSKPDGYKVVYTTSGTPTYPGDEYFYVGKDVSYQSLSGLDSGTYNVRVCKYISGCIKYSNMVQVTIP